jgi:multidrug efflux system membrane fusion protein
VINRTCRLLTSLVFLSLFGGCTKTDLKNESQSPPGIPISRPVEREITEYVDFTGRTEAVELVDIRPRVTGYLVKIPFREGAEVMKNDLLFEVDPRPYQAQYDQAEGQVKLYDAQLRLAKTTLARDMAIASTTPGAISVQQIDQDKAAVDEAEATLNAFTASLEVYKLNLEFTKVTSPINGQVSRYYLTLGNLVNQDQTLLTTVVSLDPMHAYFDVDEPTILRVRKAINEGKIERYQSGKFSVFMALQGEQGYRHPGTLNFVDNQVNPATGSILVRGVFPNPIPETGVARILSPGMFVRIRLPLGKPHPAVLVVDRAIGSDQGLKYIYVMKPDKKIEYRRITTGDLQEDGLRVIAEGLKADEWVVIGGLQSLRPNMEINPDRTKMPTLASLSIESTSQKSKPPDADDSNFRQSSKATTNEAEKSSAPKTISEQPSPVKSQDDRPNNKSNPQ